MTIQEARKYSRKIILKGTAIIILILLFILMLGETRGDFANGILFFLDAVFNVYSFLGVIILFGLSYIFAGTASDEVILEKQRVLIIAIKYSVFIALSMTIYTVIVGIIKQNLYTSQEIKIVIADHFLDMFVRTVIFVFLVWIWGTNRMKSKRL